MAKVQFNIKLTLLFILAARSCRKYNQEVMWAIESSERTLLSNCFLNITDGSKLQQNENMMEENSEF